MTPRLAEALAAWRALPEERRAWATERLAQVDPYRMNRWTDTLDRAIAVLDAAAEPEAKDDPCAGMECVVCNTTDGNINTCEGCKDNVCEDHTERDDDNIPLCEDCMTASETDAAVSP